MAKHYSQYSQGEFHPLNKDKYKGSLPIIFRSSWEKALMIYLDNNSSCLTWGSESCVVRYISPIDKRIHRYFIDFTATFKDKTGALQKFYIEIKPKGQLEPPKKTARTKETAYVNAYKTYIVNSAKWKAALDFAKTKGAKFIIITEDQLFRK
jgi:hypothetical protein